MKINWNILHLKNQAEKDSHPQLEKIIKSILHHRGIDTPEKINQFLQPDYEKDLADPFLLLDMEKAVERVLAAIEKKEQICIYGDYDADGVTSSALLKSLFDQLKIDSFCYIPERNNEGYGLNQKALDYVKGQGAQLLITVDCGISNLAEVEYANEQGLPVIILDHHHVPENIPPALAVINPKRPNDPYPEKELAGVGVVFKFAQALCSRLKNFDAGQVKWFLDLVALGTIADCVPLLGENRTLVKFGLIVLAKTRRVGLRQLFQVGRINISENNLPSSHQVAFQLAPRINAAGRVEHANTAYQLLTAPNDDTAGARVLALELEEKNQRRQKITNLITQEVEKRIANKATLPKIIIESDPNWELGVIGLAAGKITEKFNRPTILLKSNGDWLKGSARSIKCFNMIEALEKNKLLLEKYGGHRQAAGMTLSKKNLDAFKQSLEKEMETVCEADLNRQLDIDAELDFSEINETLLSQLSLFEPFGQENRQPIFLSKNLLVHDYRIVGNGTKHLKLWLKCANDSCHRIVEGICFGAQEKACLAKTGDIINAVYTLEEDSWNGTKKIQLKILDIEPVAKKD